MVQKKSVFNVFFWWRSKATKRIQWCIKWKRKKYIVDKVEINVLCNTKNRKSNPHGVIEGKCKYISFERIKRNNIKLVIAKIQ